jgi:5'-nucleotidase
MAYPIDKKLVIAVASSALFDLSDSDPVYQRSRQRDPRLEEYRKYQRRKENVPLDPGVAFPLVRRLLRLNAGIPELEAPVEVVLLSRNDPDTGLRVMNSIETHKLAISRAAFVTGGDPHRYMNALNASLFLSANAADVRSAVNRGLPAAQVFPTKFTDQEADLELRIAFDFDGVVADDSSEAVYKKSGLKAFQESEVKQALKALREGPLARFFTEVSRLQRFERNRRANDKKYIPRLRTAIITARNAPAHKRVVATLRDWGIEVDEVFFLGGIAKDRIMRVLRPHIFFDDQLSHIESTAGATPSAHVPFGVANPPSPELVRQAHAEYARFKKAQERALRNIVSTNQRHRKAASPKRLRVNRGR